jgi:hypothetical protein
MPILQNTDNKEWLSAIKNVGFESAEKAEEYVNNLSETIADLMKPDDMGLIEGDFSRGILAWDMGRMVVVARMCFDQGLISAPEAWGYIREAHVQTKAKFKDWKEVANSYLIGRAMWSGPTVMLDGIKTIAKELLTKEGSPWLSITLQ